MCLAVPGKIVEINDETAVVEVGGVLRKVSLMLVPDAKTDDYVLVHAGFAIQVIDEKEALETLELLREMVKDETY